MMPLTAIDPFAPLSITKAVRRDASGVIPAPVHPVPTDAQKPDFRHHTLGAPSSAWIYTDTEDRLLGYVVRFDTPAGKQVLPLSWCRMEDRSQRWCWRSFAEPRPLYGLARLAERKSAPVLVVEGEKTADAAQQKFPDHVAMTWPGGANAVAKADWSVLSGRIVVVARCRQVWSESSNRSCAPASWHRYCVCPTGFLARWFAIGLGSRRSCTRRDRRQRAPYKCNRVRAE
jgi:hypothetical protein